MNDMNDRTQTYILVVDVMKAYYKNRGEKSPYDTTMPDDISNLNHPIWVDWEKLYRTSSGYVVS
jgi:hypothetical protein